MGDWDYREVLFSQNALLWRSLDAFRELWQVDLDTIYDMRQRGVLHFDSVTCEFTIVRPAEWQEMLARNAELCLMGASP